ncbi:MAG: hypothetical protein ABSB35_25535 [Bryobacteraceae bacterium]
MRERFHQLFFDDRRWRAKMYAVAFAISVPLGLASFALGSSDNEAVALISLSATTVVLIWIYLYCSRLSRPAHVNVPLVVPRRAIVANLVISAAGIAVGLRTTQIEAAIIRRKLQRYSDPRAIDKEAIEVVTSTITYANESKIALDSKVVSSVADSIIQADRTGQSDLGPDAYRAVEVLADTQSAIQAKTNPQAQSHLQRGNVFPGLWGFVDSMIEMVPIALDKRIFVNTLFVKCQVSYDGGPVKISGTSFEGCTFQVVDTEQGKELLGFIAHGNPVNYSYRADELPPLPPDPRKTKPPV